MPTLTKVQSTTAFAQALSAILDGPTVTRATPTAFEIRTADHRYLINGTDLAYDIQDGFFTGFAGGTITTLLVEDLSPAKTLGRIIDLDLDVEDLPSVTSGNFTQRLAALLAAESWTVNGTNGADSLLLTSAAGFFSNVAVTVWGFGGNDTLVGGGGGDTLMGGLGHDELRDSVGNDSLFGDGGNDRLIQAPGAGGNDTMNGGAGNDLIEGGKGNDSLLGLAGKDTIDGGAGADTIDGGGGVDSIIGAAGNDSILGGAGLDRISGGDGADTIDGGLGEDRIFGDAGHDLITGGLHADRIDGGAGNDTITGGIGPDTLTGGSGADQFNFGPGDGTDRITDFEADLDTIFIELAAGETFQLVQNGANASILYGDGGRIVLENTLTGEIVLNDNLLVVEL